MITLYRKGDKHVIRGHLCEARTFSIEELDEAINDGWCSMPDLSDSKEAIKEKVDTNKSGKLSNDEIREAAKKAGIENWEKARISTLKKSLGL